MEEKRQIEFEQLAQVAPRRAQATIRKRANTLDGKTWTRYSISIWSNIKKDPEEMNLGHPAIFPKELPKRLLQCFTTEEDEIILDPFVGMGSTLLAAEELGKVGIGLDIYPHFIDKCNERLAQTRFEETSLTRISRSKAYSDTVQNLMKYVSPNSVDIVITSPPYWDIQLQERTANHKQSRPYGELDADLSKTRSYKDFLERLKSAFKLICQALKPGKYCIVVVMDIRKKDKLYPLHSDLPPFMQEIGFIYDDLIIWDRRHEYNNMRPLGYPTQFRINRAHEYILIFRKLFK